MQPEIDIIGFVKNQKTRIGCANPMCEAEEILVLCSFDVYLPDICGLHSAVLFRCPECKAYSACFEEKDEEDLHDYRPYGPYVICGNLLRKVIEKYKKEFAEEEQRKESVS